MQTAFSEYTNLANSYITAAGQYVTFHSIELAYSFVVLVMVGLIVLGMNSAELYLSRKRYKVSRGSKMVGQAREAEERVLLSDRISDVLEELERTGKFTPDQVLKWADRFANLCDLRDLISSKQLTIKQSLRLNARLRKRRGPVTPVPIPGPAPATVVPKNAFDALVRGSKIK